MQNSITENVRELVRHLDEKQQHFLKELDDTENLQSKILVRENLRHLRADFHKRIDRLQNGTAPES